MEFAPEVMRQLVSAPWPGNVRQLRNEVMRLAACARLNVIGEEDLWEGIPRPGAISRRSARQTAIPEEGSGGHGTQMIAEALQETRNNQQQAARLSGLSRRG